jgi:hypothetical protein
MRFYAVALLAGVCALGAVPASAATVTTTVTFSATNFFPYKGHNAPVDPVTGSFTVTFDTTHDVQHETSGIVLNNLNIPYDTTKALQYDYSAAHGALTIYNQIGGVIPGDFVLDLHPDSTLDFFLYTTLFDPSYPNDGSGQYGLFTTGHVTADFTTPLTPFAATPIPPAVVMFLSAIGVLGLVGFRRGRPVAAR